MLGFGKSKKAGGPYRFRVSDALEMPHRGFLLRLRVSEGTPQVGSLAVGESFLLIAPDGRERVARISDHSVTAGRVTQERLDRVGEFDVVIDRADGWIDDDVVEIGWTVAGPVGDERGQS
jgi:hypothetical protein